MTSDREFFRDLKEHLMKIAELTSVMQQHGSENLYEDLLFIQENLKYLKEKCNKYLYIKAYYELTNELVKNVN